MTQTDGPETNEDYDKIFGGGGPAAAPAEDLMEFDPTEAVHFADVAPGRYIAFVAEPPKKETSQNGNPMMFVRFTITAPEEYAGAPQFRRYMLSGKGGGWTQEFLRALDMNDEAEGKKPISPKDIEGKRLVIHVKKQKNNPEFMEVWKVERHPDGPAEGSLF